MATRTPHGKIRIMEVLVDTNVILDVLDPNRKIDKAALKASQGIWQAADKGLIIAYISASSATDLFYIIGRSVGAQIARQSVRACLHVLKVGTVDRAILEAADQLPGSDFEDNVQIACALAEGLDTIVTRDQKFFRGLVPLLAPEQLLKQI